MQVNRFQGRTRWLGEFIIVLAVGTRVLAGPCFVPLGTLPGGEESQATAISRDGLVVVGYTRFGALGRESEAFRWTAMDGMVGLGGLPGWETDASRNSRANEVSAHGEVIIGRSDSTLRPDGEAFRWTADGGMEPMITHLANPTSLRSSGANAISDDGGIIYGSGVAFNNGQYSLRYDHGGYHQTIRPSAQAVSSDGVLAAANRFNAGSGTNAAFRDDWSGTTSIPLGDFSGGVESAAALDITADGDTIVGWGTTSFGQEPFIWTEAGGLQRLGPLPTVFWNGAQANAISANGEIIVGEGISGAGGAFIWTPENGYQVLMDVLIDDFELDLQNWQYLISATDVSGDGTTIVGYGVNPSGRFEAFVARIPSPGAGSFVIAGLFWAAARRRRK